MIIGKGKCVVVVLRSPRFKRTIISQLIWRGLTPIGDNFFAKIDSEEEETLLIKSDELSFPDPSVIEEEKRKNAIAVYFLNDMTAAHMIRYIAFSERERRRVWLLCSSAMESLQACFDSKTVAPADPDKKNKA